MVRRMIYDNKRGAIKSTSLLLFLSFLSFFFFFIWINSTATESIIRDTLLLDAVDRNERYILALHSKERTNRWEMEQT